MEKLVLCLILILFLCCKPQSTVSETAVQEEKSISQASASKMTKETKMKEQQLQSYFSDLPFPFYDNCNGEKGTSEDFFSGTKIPNEVANSYKLYKLASIPKLGMKRRATSTEVEFMAIGKTKVQDATILIYTIGINVRTNDDNAAFGYETRLAIMKDDKITNNYFLGGEKRAEVGKDDSMMVCRLLEVVENKIKLTLYKEASIKVPSSLRLDDEESKGLE